MHEEKGKSKYKKEVIESESKSKEKVVSCAEVKYKRDWDSFIIPLCLNGP